MSLLSLSFFLFSLIFAINFLFTVHHCPKQEGDDANSHDTHQREHDVGYQFATASCAHGGAFECFAVVKMFIAAMQETLKSVTATVVMAVV